MAGAGVGLVAGEQVLFAARLAEDGAGQAASWLTVTTLRVQAGSAREIPLGAISSAKASRAQVHVQTRGPLHAVADLASSEDAAKAAQAIRHAATIGKDEGLSAVKRAKLLCGDAASREGWRLYEDRAELARQKLPAHLRIYDQTEAYKLCKSYPRFLAVPSNVSDEVLRGAAAFRSGGRIPVVTWIHPRTRAVMARSAQPLVGIRNQTSDMDEMLVEALMLPGPDCGASSAASSSFSTASSPPSPSSEATATTASTTATGAPEEHPPQPPRPPPRKKHEDRGVHHFVANVWSNIFSAEEHGYVIMDARSQIAAMGNAMIGKGTENPNNYKGARVVFNGIDNIHALRTSYLRLVRIAQDDAFEGDFYGAVADSGWVQHVKAVLRASVRLAETLDVDGVSVLTHCSDGWDRTAQMCALAQLMCDAHYRTLDGFAVLVEKEWCAFGHKFRHRCRGSTSDNEFSPVFLLFLDCVRQLVLQFPRAFEFNEEFLLYLADATQTDETATFLANTQQYRMAMELSSTTASVWPCSPAARVRFLSSHFAPTAHAGATLLPSMNGKRIRLWTRYFFRFDPDFLLAEGHAVQP